MTWELREDGNVDMVDRSILVFIASHRIDSLNAVAVDLTALGSPTVLTLFAIIGVAILLMNHDRRGAFFLSMGSAGMGLGTYFLKNLFDRDRPTIVPRLIEVSGFSYPSGHSFGSTSFYLFLMLLSWRFFQSFKTRAVLFCIATFLIGAICFSRLYLGVHYPSDVFSGIVIGIAWVCLLSAFIPLQRLGQ